jgi:hypothetical protein
MRLPAALLLALAVLPSAALSAGPPAVPAAAPPAVPDSKQIEKELQRLPWPQFRTVIEGIPKLKAEIEAYGPMGWQFVQANYKTHGWKKNVDRLDDAQKRQLAALIRSTKAAR